MERAFDAYCAVDWSARSTPATGANSLWWALLRPGGPGALPALELRNARTRQAFVDEALRRLGGELAGARVLLGFDFPLGYPRGLGAALDGVVPGERPWLRTWRRLASAVRDGPDNANNRLEVAAALNAELTGGYGPFYGRPAGAPAHVALHLSSTRRGVFEYPLRTRAGVALAERRQADVAARAASSPWFVFGGANSVGGQALLGIPRVAALRRQVQGLRVWPFETRPVLPGRDEARVVVAEIYPSLHHRGGDEGDGTVRERGAALPDDAVKDARQVVASVRAFVEADARGELAAWFAAPPRDPAVLEEEGWVLGVPAPGGVDRGGRGRRPPAPGAAATRPRRGVRSDR